MNFYDPFLDLIKAQRNQIDQGILSLQKKIQERRQSTSQKNIHYLHQQLQDLAQKQQANLINAETKKKPSLKQRMKWNQTPDFDRSFQYDYAERMSTIKKYKGEIFCDMMRDKYLHRPVKKNKENDDPSFGMDNSEINKENGGTFISPREMKKETVEDETPYHRLQKAKTQIQQEQTTVKKLNQISSGKLTEKTKRSKNLTKQQKEKLRESNAKLKKNKKNLTQSNRKISLVHLNYGGKKRCEQLKQISPHALGSNYGLRLEIERRMKCSSVYEDSKHRHERHEQEHLKCTYENEEKARNQIIHRISLHPTVLKKFGMNVA